MHPSAIHQAEIRLEKASTATERLKRATCYEESEDAWTDFLLACSAVYSKLEQGAKQSGKSQAWFGRVRKIRKDDELLRYLHFARNTDEHGIERITAQEGGNATRMIHPVYGERHRILLQAIDQKTLLPKGEEVPGVLNGARLRCIRVVDSRFNDACDPPTIHMGKPIHIPEVTGIPGGDFPDVIADLALSYLRSLINEARSYAP